MSMTLEELHWLLDEDGSSASPGPAAIAAASDMAWTKTSSVRDASALRERFGPQARAAIELVRARRSLAAKMDPTRAETWWSDVDAAQQATPQSVAAFRAQYLRSLGVTQVADVTCSVGADLVALREAGLDAAGSDLDPVRLQMARRNAPDTPLACADALRPVWTAGVVVADPARRTSSGRVHRLDQLQPPLPELAEAYRGRELAVKCAPGIDYARAGDWVAQVDVVSVDGNVKEACLYTAGLRSDGAADPARGGASSNSETLLRRAVVIRDGRAQVWTSASPEIDHADAGPDDAGRYIIDPDGAIVRAGLVRHYAHAHGLRQLDPQIAYLTGDSVPQGERGFEIVDCVGLKKLRAALKARDAKSVEILVRGVDVDPDKLRSKLTLTGSQAWSVVITRVGRAGVAYICRPPAPAVTRRGVAQIT